MSGALRHAVRPAAWRGALNADLRKARIAAPARVGIAVALMFVVGGLTGHHDVAGFAALGALVSAFCRPDPYPVRVGRLSVLSLMIVSSIAAGAALGACASPVAISVVVIALIAGTAAYFVSALHVVGPGAVVLVFAAVGAEAFAHDIHDALQAVAASAVGTVTGMVASLAPWLLGLARQGVTGRAGTAPHSESGRARRESVTVTLIRAPHVALLKSSARIAVAGALGAAVALAFGLPHYMWAMMGAVATIQGVAYHVAIHRGVQRLLGNIGGALLAAGLLALPLGYWGTAAAIVFFQTCAEVAATVNYALTSLAVTPMALLLTGLGAGLTPGAALDRVLDTLVGVVVGVVIGALTISGADSEHLRTAGRH
ncbi:FUSC family protein [Mycolicibacterium sp. CH28]|uniref:FUSC family protein n=1 Tax=Mycolicibacterium sp. CH28 TaxID=2512237 RepID=UPI0010809303|nr:FUSC family protein [Mycolicibacterium sp. CH28]TGD85709.1 FUSC family protein [Mycolicibacterium sp. CH28]